MLRDLRQRFSKQLPWSQNSTNTSARGTFGIYAARVAADATKYIPIASCKVCVPSILPLSAVTAFKTITNKDGYNFGSETQRVGQVAARIFMGCGGNKRRVCPAIS